MANIEQYSVLDRFCKVIHTGMNTQAKNVEKTVKSITICGCPPGITPFREVPPVKCSNLPSYIFPFSQFVFPPNFPCPSLSTHPFFYLLNHFISFSSNTLQSTSFPFQCKMYPVAAYPIPNLTLPHPLTVLCGTSVP